MPLVSLQKMRNKRLEELKKILDPYAKKYNRPDFVVDDPISIPHRFAKSEDIEIAGFWTASLAWGNRKSIIRSATELCRLMDDSPHEFILHHGEKDRKRFERFVHRTFQYTDSLYFLEFLQHWYQNHGSLEQAFSRDDAGQRLKGMEAMLNQFYAHFFSRPHVPDRTRKHVSRPAGGSRCKRLLMFLRWMVRKDDNGVDFGIWQELRPDELMLPLDVHVERTARKLGMLSRKSLDWMAVEELTSVCRLLHPEDPCLYDFALFGMGLESEH